MAILTALQDIFESGDPILRSWPLVQSYWHPFALSGLYVFFIKRLGPALMQNRKPYDLRLLMIFYNFIIVAVYSFNLLTLLWYFVTTDAYKALCSSTPVRPDHYSYTCTSAGWYIYILKYVEYADTVFFILRKKDHLITNLHVIHHAVLPILGWIMMRTETSGFQFVPGGINAFIHIVMYTYYGLAAMGPSVRKLLWWKEYLTLLQMAQFIVILMFMFVVVPLSGCKTTTHGVYLDITFASLFLALFYNFYKKTYKAKDKNGAAHPISNGVNGINKYKGNGVCKQNGNGVHTNGNNEVHKLNGNGVHKNDDNEVHKLNGNGVHKTDDNEIHKSNGSHKSNGVCLKEE